MAKNQRYPEAKHITLPLPYDREPGEAVQVGAFNGIALNGGTEGEKVTVWLDGSWDVPVTTAASPGDVIGIDDEGVLAVGTGTPWGIAIGATTAAGTVEAAPYGKTTPAGGASSVSWGAVTGKPTSFPSTIADVDGLQDALDAKADA